MRCIYDRRHVGQHEGLREKGCHVGHRNRCRDLLIQCARTTCHICFISCCLQAITLSQPKTTHHTSKQSKRTSSNYTKLASAQLALHRHCTHYFFLNVGKTMGRGSWYFFKFFYHFFNWASGNFSCAYFKIGNNTTQASPCHSGYFHRSDVSQNRVFRCSRSKFNLHFSPRIFSFRTKQLLNTYHRPLPKRFMATFLFS